jgi:hypothetical protein
MTAAREGVASTNQRRTMDDKANNVWEAGENITAPLDTVTHLTVYHVASQDASKGLAKLGWKARRSPSDDKFTVGDCMIIPGEQLELFAHRIRVLADFVNSSQ